MHTLGVDNERKTWTMAFGASAHDFRGRAGHSFRNFGGWLAAAGFGVFVMVAAGFALLATTFIGVMLAIAALFLKAAHVFHRGRGLARPKKSRRTRVEGETIEARRTPQGWVVDFPNGADGRS